MVFLGAFFLLTATLVAQSIVLRPARMVLKPGAFMFGHGTRVDADDDAWPEAEKLWKLLLRSG